MRPSLCAGLDWTGLDWPDAQYAKLKYLQFQNACTKFRASRQGGKRTGKGQPTLVVGRWLFWLPRPRNIDGGVSPHAIPAKTTPQEGAFRIAPLNARFTAHTRWSKKRPWLSSATWMAANSPSTTGVAGAIISEKARGRDRRSSLAYVLHFTPSGALAGKTGGANCQGAPRRRPRPRRALSCQCKSYCSVGTPQNARGSTDWLRNSP